MAKKFTKFKKKSGISLMLTVFLLSLMLSISLGIFNIIYNELILSGDIRSTFFALYAADEIIEKTVYLDKISRRVCLNLSGNCYVTPLISASNNACNSIQVSKITGINFGPTQRTGYAEIQGLGQYPGGTPCNTTSPLLSKRSLFFKYPMVEMENLVGWWKFDNESGQTVNDWTPNSSSGNLGTASTIELNDPSRQNTVPQTVSGGSLQFFESEGDTVTYTNRPSLNINWPISITAWVCNKSAITGYKTIMKKGTSATEESYGLYLFQPPTGNYNLRFKFKDSGGIDHIADSSTIPDSTLNRWTHVIVTYDGSQVKFYYNGTTPALSIINLGASADITSAELRLGINVNDGTQNFHGILDEVKIFNKTLTDGSNNTPNEILREYNLVQPTGNPGGPAWQC